MVNRVTSLERDTQIEKPFLFVLAMAMFFVGASEFMLVAMLDQLSAVFQTSVVGAAWLISIYAFSYAIAVPLLGYLSGRVDRRKLLHIALLAFAIDGVGIAFAPSLEIAIGLRIFGGIASAVIIPTAFALISESTPKERQASAMGMVLGHDFWDRARTRKRGNFDDMGELASPIFGDVVGVCQF